MPPPRIIEHPTNVELPVTETAVFVCVGQGYGFVDVTWVTGKRNNERSPPDKSTVTTMVTPDNITTITSILTIPDVNDRDGRHFRCIYNNTGGETHSNIAKLTIGGKY